VRNSFSTRRLLVAGVLASSLAGVTTAEAAPTTYVHPSAPSCGGFSPCFANLHAAIQNVDNNGTVIVLASLADNIFQTFSKTGITVRGNTPSIAINGGVSVTGSVMTGWTIRDLVFNNSITIQDVAVSLTLQGLSATGIRLGEFTLNTSAAITVSGVTLPGGPAAEISILGGTGSDIGGSITISNNVGVYVLNVFSRTSGANPAPISANITVSGNQLTTGTNVVVDSDGSGGVGNVTGNIQFLNNVMSPTAGALGIVVVGNATGTITGPVTFTGNSGKALVVNTTGSTVGGGIGSILANANNLEAIEIDAKGPLSGPVLITGNTIVDKGSGAPEPPKVQADGHPVSGDVTIDNTTGGVALLSTTSVAPGGYSGLIRIRGNACRRIVVDSQGGAITKLVTITNNSLAPAASPDSSLTIRTLAGGTIAGGEISGNTLDQIQFDLAGGLAGSLSVNSNTVREQAAFINSGGVGAGTSTLQGNNFTGLSYFQGITSVLRYNRVFNSASFVPGAAVDARYNWWGCNGGPGTPGCTAGTGGVSVYPWMIFNSETRCASASSATQLLALTQAVDGTLPAGSVTPGFATVTTTQGSVSSSPVSIVGTGSAVVTLPLGATPNISAQLDSVSVTWPATCNPDQTTVALYDPAGSRFYLRNRNASAFADRTLSFGVAGMTPLMGDWNGDGVETVGAYSPASGTFFLRNSQTSGVAEIAFSFGPGGAGWVPVVGDWNGDGTDSVGLYNPAGGAFYLRNSNTTGFADVACGFGPGGAGWLPIVGDWNGDGVDTVGLYVPSSSAFFLRNSNTTGNADLAFGFGPGGAGWLPIAGDWNGDAVDTVGLYAPVTGAFYLRNANNSGFADVAFGFGPGGAGWRPLTGDFDGPF
jgi:hypothetical protein